MVEYKKHNTNMKQVRYALVILTLTLFCNQLSAQSSVQKLLKKLSTKKDSMVVRGVDRRYIDIPDQPWQVMLRGNSAIITTPPTAI